MKSITATQRELKRISKIYKKEYSLVLEDYSYYQELEYDAQTSLAINSPYWDLIASAELAKF